MNEKTLNVVARSIGALVILAFIYFGFISEQPCDIDKQYFWCRLHPFTFLDGIGLVLIAAGSIFLFGLAPKKFYAVESAGTMKNQLIAGALLLGGFLACWV